MFRISLTSALLTAVLPFSAHAASAPVNLTCMQQAVSARDTAVLSAFSTYTQTVMTSFQQRLVGLQSAWAIQDEGNRQNTIKTTWVTYKNSLKTAQTVLKDKRKDAWKVFRDARKSCNGSSNSDTGGGESVDSKL